MHRPSSASIWGMTGAREKLQWASRRCRILIVWNFRCPSTCYLRRDEKNALGRLLQEIIAQLDDINALDWVEKSSRFNNCLPADITSYKPLPSTLPFLHEDGIQTSVSFSSLRNAGIMDLASTRYTQLDNMSAPHFAHHRLHLSCIEFPVTELRRRRGQDREHFFTYDVKADGLDHLLITTEADSVLAGTAHSTDILLIRPWNRHDLGMPDFADDVQSVDDWSEPESPLDESPGGYPGKNYSGSHSCVEVDRSPGSLLAHFC
ncbi:hypothetical protein DFH29DRAFT_1023521 [Suillus ampliporus]|nr:hypothetical protein DFH29DRAFT_1023521 [Suillus ampliporus]